MIRIVGGGYKLPKRKVSIDDFRILNVSHEEWITHLYRARSKENCPKGGYHDFWGQNKRGLFECKKCGFQMSVTTGTIMEQSHVPLDKWFLLFFMVMQERENLTAITVREALGVSYPTAKFLLERTKNKEIEKWIGLTTMVIHHNYGNKSKELKKDDRVLDIDITAKYNERGEPILYFREMVLNKEVS
jgi:transposase-like protein